MSFRAFLDSQFSAELLDFLEEHADFKEAPTAAKLNGMMSRFLRLNSPSELNVAEEVKREISISTMNLEDDEVTGRELEAVERHVVHMLRLQLIPRFLASAFYQVRHRQASSLPRSLFQEFVVMCESDAHWEALETKDGVERWMASMHGRFSTQRVSAEVALPSDVLVGILGDISQDRFYVEGVLQSREVSRFSPQFSSCYTAGSSRVRVFRPRDFYLYRAHLNMVCKRTGQRLWVVMSKSVDPYDEDANRELVGTVPNAVRCTVEQAGWLVRELSPGRSRVTYVNRISFGVPDSPMGQRVVLWIDKRRTLKLMQDMLRYARLKAAEMDAKMIEHPVKL